MQSINTIKSINLRLPESIHCAVSAEAASRHVSLTAYIVGVLQAEQQRLNTERLRKGFVKLAATGSEVSYAEEAQAEVMLGESS